MRTLAGQIVHRSLKTLGAVVIALGIGSVGAQELVMPPTPEVPPLAPAAPREGLVRLGSFSFLPRISASVSYDDNLFIQDTDKVDDVMWTLGPGFTITSSDMRTDGGKSLTLSYGPSFLIYTDQTDRNTINHAAALSASLAFTKLSLGLSQTVSAGTDPVVEAGTRTDRLALGTALNARYAFGGKLSADVNFGLDITDYAARYNSWTWSNGDGLNYQCSSRVNVGVGLTLGYIDMEGFPGQNYEDLMVRATYSISEKLGVNASAGLDWRQYRSGVDDTLSPIWDVAAVYRPQERTTLSLGLFQRNYSSAYYGNQNYLSTGANVGVRQELLTRYTFSVTARYYRSDYEATVVGVGSGSTDDVVAVGTQFDIKLNERWTAGVFYEFSHNASDSRRFTRNRVGLETRWAY
jgi:hypothetical protein